jgi:hypothetical protein
MIEEDEDEAWFDEAAGPLVRPYALTRGRTRTDRYNLELITLIVSLPSRMAPPPNEPEYAHILSMCQRPVSIAEIAARLNLPIAVVKVLVSDLVDQKQVMFRAARVPDTSVLRAVLNGIEKL